MDKKKRKLPSLTFFKSLLCTFFGLIFYISGKKIIPFPEKWMGSSFKHSLFFLGILNHLTVNWILDYVFLLFDPEKYGVETIKEWKNRISKILTFFLFVVIGVTGYWGSVQGKPGKIAFLALILAIVNCLINFLIQWMNKYGICSGFSLFLFVEFLPIKWLEDVFWSSVKNSWKTGNWIGKGGLFQEVWFCLFFLLIITIFFILIINIKWEAPVESNTFHSSDNPLFKEHSFKLGFRMSFSFMPLYQLAQILNWIYIAIKMLASSPGVSQGSWLLRSVRKIQMISSNLGQKSIDWTGKNEGIGETFFLLNNKKRLFGDLSQWLRDWKWSIILPLLVLILLRWLTVWLSVHEFNLKTKDISDKLKRKGIYIDQISPGKQTRYLLKKIVNRLVFYWIVIVMIFNIIFDQVFANLERQKIKEAAFIIPHQPNLLFSSFLDWFGSVGIGIDLFRQIRTKYRYTQGR